MRGMRSKERSREESRARAGRQCSRPCLHVKDGMDEQPARSIGRQTDVRLDPIADFECYREPASRRFIAMARAMGMHAFHDLDELAEDY